MYCSKCGEKIKTTDVFCSNCGTKSEKSDNLNVNKKNKQEVTIPQKETCKICNREKREISINNVSTGKKFCIYCNSNIGYCPICNCKLDFTLSQQCKSCNSSWHINTNKPQVSISKKIISNTSSDKIQCPKCRSTNVTANKKGFSGKQAVGGAILTGGIGILAGTIGSNKMIITCLSCGKKFKPGEDLKAIRKKKRQEAEAMKDPTSIIISIIIVFVLFALLKSCF